MTHDQYFKNLIIDYPLEAVALFAASEAQAIDADARVTPVRQEQLQERLGERFRELDVPLLVEWPDGRREAILFVIEEANTAFGSTISGGCASVGRLMEPRMWRSWITTEETRS